MTAPAARNGGRPVEQRICFGLFLLAAVLFAVDRWPRSRGDAPLPTHGQVDAVESAWQDLLQDLLADAERAAERVRRAVTVPLGSVPARQRVFEELDRASRQGGRTLLLVDADGLVQAWGGPGLRHDLPLDRLLPGGICQNAGFTAVSLYATVDMNMDEGGWRLIAGSSFPTDSLPIPAPTGLRRHGVRWSVRDHAAEPLTSALEALGIRELAPPDGVPGPWLRLRFEPTTERSSGMLADLALAVLLLGVALSMSWAFRRWKVRAPARPRPAAAVSGLAGITAAVGYGLFRWQIGIAENAGAPVDPGGSFGGPIGHWAVLLTAWSVLAGTALRAFGWPEGRNWLHVLVTATAAAIGVGVLVEMSHRPALRTLVFEDMKDGFDARTAEEAEALAGRMAAFVESTDLAELALGDPAELDDRQDLALQLWNRSPLAASEMVSALAVIREGEVSTFSYGLPVDAATGDLEAGGARRPARDLRAWRDRHSASGELSVGAAGRHWGTVRFWAEALPRVEVWNSPDSAIGAEPEVRLLRGGPDRGGSGAEPPAGAVFAYIDGAGRPLVSPWLEDWRLPPPSETADPRRAMRVETPAGPALAWFSPTGLSSLWIVALLPEEAAPERLWRVATVAARLLLAVSAAALAVFAVGLPTAKLRRRLLPDARRYSVRLTAVLALIAIIPLALLNGLLFRSLAARVQAEQEAAGRTALASLESVLTDFLLGLEAGFSIEAELDDELLAWLAEIVDHEVNLYWRGSVYASSKPDLFTAGLMPKRIPANVYSRLALLGHPDAARVQTTRQGTSYLELYTPVSLGEVRPGESGLFVSVPLLAQQEAATRELAALRKQALVVTTGLALLLVTVVTRLARGFTRPLMRMIDGAERIAGGAASLGFAPQETELRTLAHAIDGMAARIAATRNREEAEKRLLQGVVENITSGIVSLDRDGRVVMANRNAASLLGVSVGESMAATGDAKQGLGLLESVAGLVRRASSGIEQITVSLGGGDTRRDWTVIRVPVAGDGEPAALLVIEDVTDVFRAQRLEAWAEMARLIAHDVKNPLTPIRLSTEHLRQVWREAPERLEEVFERCTDNILVQVEELARTAGEFLTYSRIPLARPAPDDLADAVREVVDGYAGTAPGGGVTMAVEILPDAADTVLAFDRRLIQKALRNLIENAVRASGEGGAVLVRIESDSPAGTVSVTVADRGPGVSDSDLERIFEPYFSTSSGGTGLGLPIARRIVQEHGGSITAGGRAGGGLAVRIVLPRDQSAAPSSADDVSR